MTIDTFIISFVFFIIFTQKSALYCEVTDNRRRISMQCQIFNYIYFYPEIECLRICVYLISFGCRVSLLNGST